MFRHKHNFKLVRATDGETISVEYPDAPPLKRYTVLLYGCECEEYISKEIQGNHADIINKKCSSKTVEEVAEMFKRPTASEEPAHENQGGKEDV